MTETKCLICKRPGRARLVEADISDGMKPADIAANFRADGWAITAQDVKDHDAHAPKRERSQAARKRGAAVALKERIMDEIERRIDAAEAWAREETRNCEANLHDHDPRTHDAQERFNLLDKDLQAAFGTVIKAETLQVKKEAAETGMKIDMFRMMLGSSGGLAPLALVAGDADGDVIEGEAARVD